MAQPTLNDAETAVRQVVRLGHSPAVVRQILLTHLDVDHCGGLPDFPDAQGARPRFRYRPAHWAHGPEVGHLRPHEDDWFGFGSIQPRGLPPEVRLVPLPGHTAGHTGVVVQNNGRWLLHCGDAYYYHRELAATAEPHPVLDVVQTRSEVHRDDPWELAGYSDASNLAR